MHVFIYQFMQDYQRMQEKIQEKKFERMVSFTRKHKSEKKLPYFFHFVLFWFSLFVHLKYMTVLSTKT